MAPLEAETTAPPVMVEKIELTNDYFILFLNFPIPISNLLQIPIYSFTTEEFEQWCGKI